MPKKLNILFLSPYLPAVDTSVCARKIYDCVVLLKQRGHNVYLLSFCSEDDKTRAESIKPYCVYLYLECIKDYLRYPYYPISLGQKIYSLCKRESIDILQCEKSYMSKYIPRDIKVPSILVEHDVLSVLFSKRGKLENHFFRKIILSARAGKKRFEENNWYRKFRRIIVFSDNDKDVICRLYSINKEDISVIPLGIALKDYPLLEKSEKAYDLIFVANFSHHPNVDAVLYFYKKILPLIKNGLSHISVVIAGPNLPENIKILAKSDRNIILTGYIRDILKIYSKAKIAIVPIRYGTGMRYKILEAMALGVPVVSTSIGASGILTENIRIADTPKEFADSVVELLHNQNKCDYLSENARLTVERYYNWDVLLDGYENIYYELLK